jgi:hypothetical protein
MIKDNVMICCSIILKDCQLNDKAKNATECIAQKQGHKVLITYR